jgi:hypothetical protein
MIHSRLMLSLLIAVMLLSMFWCWGQLSDARRRAEAAAADLIASERIAQRIEIHRQKPSIGASAEPHLELSRRIEQAARAAELDAASLERIGPEQQRRLGDSAVERTRQVFLRQLTMRQLVEFLHTLSAENPGLQITSLRLNAPRGEEEAGERWRAEVTLTYWLQAPSATTVASGER